MKRSEVFAQIDRTVLAQLLEKSDARAFWILFFNYGVVTACFVSVAIFPHLGVIVLAAAILAGRQLGLAILMHDCAHNAFFKTRALNEFFGKWLCAAPLMADLNRYRTYHLEHHRTAGSVEDPDRSNYCSYPVSKKSLARKFLRDLFGITGVKIFIVVLKMNAGTVAYQLSYDQNKMKTKVPFQLQFLNALKGLWPNLLVHALLFALLAGLGFAPVYLLWWLAWFTFYMVFSRLRNAAEHGAVVDINDLNPLKNTRTTLASWWERLFVAPNFVNYHIEHHLLPTVPPYHLPLFHRILSENGVISTSKVAQGYKEVLRDLTFG